MRRSLRRLALAPALAGVASWPAVAADVMIAVPGPETGPQAVLAREIRRGVDAAAQDINAKGGVLGERLSIKTFDDQCSEQGGRASAGAVIDAGAAVVIGHPCTNAALAAASSYAKARTLFFAPTVRHPALTSAPEQATVGLTFRLAGRDDRQGDAAADWLVAQSPSRAIAIVHDRTAYAKAIAEATEKRLKTLGLTPLVLTIVAGHRDYPEITGPVLQKKIEALVFAGFPDEAAIVLTGLRSAGSAAAFLGSDTLATPSFAERAAADSGTVRVLYPANGMLDLKARANTALEAWAQAVNASGSRDPAVVQKQLRSAPVSTPQGDLAFDAEGDLAGPSYVAARAGVSSWVADETQKRAAD